MLIGSENSSYYFFISLSPRESLRMTLPGWLRIRPMSLSPNFIRSVNSFSEITAYFILRPKKCFVRKRLKLSLSISPMTRMSMRLFVDSRVMSSRPPPTTRSDRLCLPRKYSLSFSRALKHFPKIIWRSARISQERLRE